MNSICSITNCTNKIHAKGICNTHRLRIKKYGDPYFTKFHGLSKTDEYRIWKGMKYRCFNSNLTGYKYYGGRGIKVCDEWLKSFKAFYDYMGPRPTKRHSIDRINNSGNYEPGNCRWATQLEQMHNRG